MSSLEEQLKTLRAAIVYEPPFSCGTASVDPNELLFFYGKEDGTSGRIDFNEPAAESLLALSDACDPATFGRGDEDVHDESYRKAGKLDSSCFANKFDFQKNGLLNVIHNDLLQGWNSQESIYAELYKVNVYGPGSFFKSHQDTPRGENMFGSLVIVYPTPHEGGALIFRDGDGEWTFDSAQALSKREGPCVAYMAFYSDVEHEVTPVVSGYRVTVTYNLYYATTKVPATLVAQNYRSFKKTLQDLLDDSNFLPEGGRLGFGMCRIYPAMKDPDTRKHLNYLKRFLKGSDAWVLEACETLELKTNMWQLVSGEFYGDYTLLLSHAVSYQRGGCEAVEDDGLERLLINEHDAVRINCIDFQSSHEAEDEEDPELAGPILKEDDDTDQFPVDFEVDWVTKPNDYNERIESFPSYGNEPSLAYAYGHFVMIAEVGPVGKRGTVTK